MSRRFSLPAAEQVGRMSAYLWTGGIAALHNQRIPVSAELHAGLAPMAAQVVSTEQGGAQFLTQIGQQLGTEAAFHAFLEAIQLWYRRNYGTGRLGPRMGSGAHGLGSGAYADPGHLRRPTGHYRAISDPAQEELQTPNTPPEGTEVPAELRASDTHLDVDEDEDEDEDDAEGVGLFGVAPEDMEIGEMFADASPEPVKHGLEDLRTEIVDVSALDPDAQRAALADMNTKIFDVSLVPPSADGPASAPEAAAKDDAGEAAPEPPDEAPEPTEEQRQRAEDLPTETVPLPAAALKKVAGFEILDLLGTGGMGHVYRGIQRSLDREVALKVLNPALAIDEDYSKRLEQEAKAAARLRHPNVVGVIEQGTCPTTGVRFVAFEFVEGPTAKELLSEQGKLPEADALTICLGIAEALSCAEDHQIVHRDVKPDNILISKSGIPMLADLGLAKRQDTKADDLDTQTGLFMGTPYFAAPEQALALDDIDGRADLYSLGICLWQFLTGELPLPAETPIGILTRRIKEDVPDPREVNPEISREAWQLIQGLSARKRDQRYATAKLAVENIKRVLDGKPPVLPKGQQKAKGRVIAPRKKTSTGVRSGPSAIPSSTTTEVPVPEAEPELPVEETAPEPERKVFRGRGFYDDLIQDTEKLEVKDSKIDSSKRFSGRGFYDDVGGEPDDAEETPAADPPEPEAPAHDAELLEKFRVDGDVDSGPAAEVDEDAELLLSDDTERAYRVGKLLGEGTQGQVFAAEIVTGQRFEGFNGPVNHAVIKLAKDGYSLDYEKEVYEHTDPRILRLLDAGSTFEGNTYLVLERLHEHPGRRFSQDGRPARVDPGTATELFVNLLESLKGLHFRRKQPLVLCNLKPANLMLRLPGAQSALSDEDYFDYLMRGNYEAVFVDLNAAQDRDELRKRDGRASDEGQVGDPLYLPPESVAQRGAPATYSEKTDVYGLCLTYYTFLTGELPYARELAGLQGADYLRKLLELKERGILPIQERPVREHCNDLGKEVIALIHSGLLPEVEKRANAGSLLLKAKKLFKLDQARGRMTPADYRYDHVDNGVRYKQTVFPRVRSAMSVYADHS